MIKIPYSVVPPKFLIRSSKSFYWISEVLRSFFPSLRRVLSQADMNIDEREYLSMCIFSNIITALFLFFFIFMISKPLEIERPFIAGLSVTLILVFFILIQQLMYPQFLVNKKVKNVEKNLIPALQ